MLHQTCCKLNPKAIRNGCFSQCQLLLQIQSSIKTGYIMEIFLLASVLELNPLDHIQLRGSRLCTATEGRSHMLKSYGRAQSLREETRAEDEPMTLPGAHICLQKSRGASTSPVLSPSPLCHFTHLWMCLFPRDFVTCPWVSDPLAISSCPVGDLVPFESAVVGQARQEWWSLLPACKATPVLLTAHSSPQAERF